MSYAFWRKLDTLIIIWTYKARESDGKHFATLLQMSQHPSQKQSILKPSLIFLWTTKINGKKGKDRGNQYVWPSCLYKYIIYKYTYRYWINQLNQAHVYQDATLLSPAPTHSLSRIKTSRNRGICPVIAVDVGSSQNIFASEVANLLQLML